MNARRRTPIVSDGDLRDAAQRLGERSAMSATGIQL
jgi:hypothetical protein